MNTATKHRICIAGASGRMGHMLIELVLASDDCVLSGALDMAGAASVGTDATAFLGRRHFDDADLIERRFRLTLPE